MTNLFRAVSLYFVMISLKGFFTILVGLAAAVAEGAVHCEVNSSYSHGSTNTVVSSHSPPSAAVKRFEHWLAANGYSGSSHYTGPILFKTHQSPSARLPQKFYAIPPPHPIKKQINKSMMFSPVKVIERPISDQQSKQIMLNSVPSAGNMLVENADEATAFQNMVQKNMPLTPKQMVRLHQQIDIAQQSAAIPANIPPKPVSTTLMINLAPGTTPPAIRLAQGYVSSLVFVDSAGMPWPIASFDIGNPKAIAIQWDGKSNILLLQAVAPYSNGNMVVRLVGLTTPITLELVAGQRVVDYRADIHIAGAVGPNAKDIPVMGLPHSATPVLLGVLDGVAPPGSKILMMSGEDCQAWLLHEKLYLRTRFTLLSPGWIGKMVSADGMKAYELQKASSVLVSRYGDPVELKIEGF